MLCKIMLWVYHVRRGLAVLDFFKMTTNFFFLYFSRGEYLVYSSYSDTLPPEVLQRQWKKQKFHYDTVPTAMLTLFAVQTTEGWPVYV